MLYKIYKSRRGFTLVEIMITVAIIGLLVSLALPAFLRARKRSQAAAVKNDLRVIEVALDQYAVENKVSGVIPTTIDISAYIKTGTRMHKEALAGGLTDSLGNSIIIPTVDSPMKIPAATYSALTDVADSTFWAPYSVN